MISFHSRCEGLRDSQERVPSFEHSYSSVARQTMQKQTMPKEYKGSKAAEKSLPAFCGLLHSEVQAFICLIFGRHVLICPISELPGISNTPQAQLHGKSKSPREQFKQKQRIKKKPCSWIAPFVGLSHALSSFAPFGFWVCFCLLSGPQVSCLSLSEFLASPISAKGGNTFEKVALDSRLRSQAEGEALQNIRWISRASCAEFLMCDTT